MNNYPLVSVIIPNYNHARYLDQRLQTVLGHTYPNFEVIILDDQSTDNSLEVIAKYKDNPHVSHIVVNEKNSGSTFKQWDKGIHLAKGDLIWIAESDDYCELNFIDEMVSAFLLRKKMVLAYCVVTLVDDNGNIIEEQLKKRNCYYSGKSFVSRYLLYSNFIRNASGAMFSKQAFLKCTSEYSTFKGAGDYLLWVNIALQGKVAVVHKKLSMFRRNGATTTDKKDVDGTNFIEERRIYNYITDTLNISKYRKVIAHAYRYNRYNSTAFLSPEVKQKINEMWQFSDSISFTDRVIVKIYKLAIKYLDLHL